MVTQQSCAPPTRSPLATIQTYDQLASEYDSREHATTRALEAASTLAWSRAPLPAIALPTVLEVGAGTGAMTENIVRRYPGSRLIVTDSSRRMLSEAEQRFHKRPAAAEWQVQDAEHAMARYPSEFVVAGLADPYLDAGFLEQASRGLPGSWLFATTPDAEWAVRERHDRLGVPVDTTRFVLRDGRVLRAQSLAYSAGGLADAARGAGLRIVAVGTVGSSAADVLPAVAVAWLLAQVAQPDS